MKTGTFRILDWAGYVLHFEASMGLNLGQSCSQIGPSWGSKFWDCTDTLTKHCFLRNLFHTNQQTRITETL